MRVTRTITASLAAVLGAAALAGPAAADSHEQPDSWYAGKSTIAGSTHSGQQGANGSAKANGALTPAAAVGRTGAPAGPPTWPANPQPLHRQVAASGSSPGLDWDSMGIGAAATIGAFLIALGGAAVLRRRRHVQPAATG